MIGILLLLKLLQRAPIDGNSWLYDLLFRHLESPVISNFTRDNLLYGLVSGRHGSLMPPGRLMLALVKAVNGQSAVVRALQELLGVLEVGLLGLQGQLPLEHLLHVVLLVLDPIEILLNLLLA